MKLPNFLGPSLYGRSSAFQSDRAINFYPEFEPTIKGNPGDAKGDCILIGTPGTAIWGSAGGSLPIRAAHSFAGVLYLVVGNKFYSTADGQTFTERGSISSLIGRVTIKDNGLKVLDAGGDQIMLVDGTNGYIYNVNTTNFSVISGGGWPGNPTSLEEIDGYFIISCANSMSAYASDLYDGTTWDALATSPINATADVLQVPINMHQQLAMIKTVTTEFWQDTGTAPDAGFPFSRIPGAVIDYGTSAPASVVRGDNSFFMLANQRNGDEVCFIGVVEWNGMVPQIISPPGITYKIGQWGTLSDALAFCYSGEGHTFYVLTSPSANQTLVYDASTTLWHERSSWTGAPYEIGRHVSNCYVNFSNLHLVGDYRNGNLYRLGSNIYQDNGDPLVSIRVSPHIFDKKNLETIFIHRLQIDLQAGVGDPSSNLDPEAFLARSHDNGNSFGNDAPASIGMAGDYTKRLIWRQLGASRDFVFRLSLAAPTKRVLIGAYAD
jgi:hypothetical protein